jgi:hypothetical protein
MADAAARDHDLPGLDELSLIAPQWPNGQGAYVYGSLLFEYLSDTRGAASVPKFIEQSSGEAIPFLLDRVSRESFGISFEAAWKHWRDSVSQAALMVVDPHPLGLHVLTHEGYEADYPRWIDSTTLAYVGNTERDLPGSYSVTVSGQERRSARRNSVSPEAMIPGGMVYAQLDYTSPYELRSDLYRDSGGHVVRLTHGARLTDPDVRADGRIVAVRGGAEMAQLVLVSRDGRDIRPITPATADSQWTEPRWSPDGTRLAAVEWERGGYRSIVVLDTMGVVHRQILRERAVVADPSWNPDGGHLVFTSDRNGRTQVYRAVVDTAVPNTAVFRAAGDARARDADALVLLGGSGAGVASPEVAPDGSRLAVSALRGNGYHVAVAAYDSLKGVAVTGLPDPVDTIAVPPVAQNLGPATRYSPLPGLVPKYWMPVADASDQGFFQLGVYTSAFDPVGRHAYALDALYDFRQPSQIEWSGTYEYRGLGLPVLDFGADEYWTHEYIANASGQALGLLVHRTIAASVSASLLRPRVRTNATWSLGASWELRAYHTEPGALIGNIDPFYASNPDFPSLFTVATWSNAQMPALAISPENGIALSGTARVRWQDATTSTTERSFVGVVDLYRALNLPGFAHHVIAARFAGGIENDGAISTFTAGGRSGESLEVVPGVTVGDQPRVFSVRGFPLGSETGTRALAASIEYRAPLLEPGRGWHLLPIFLGKTSVSVFADGAEAWCPTQGTVLPGVCQAQDAQRRLISSAGAELNFDTSLQYDVPYRLRLGMAIPTSNRAYYRAAPVDFYVTFGFPF